MSRVEQRLELVGVRDKAAAPVSATERGRLLALADRSVEPGLSFELRLEIAFQMRGLLNGKESVQDELPAVEPGRGEWITPRFFRPG